VLEDDLVPGVCPGLIVGGGEGGGLSGLAGWRRAVHPANPGHRGLLRFVCGALPACPRGTGDRGGRESIGAAKPAGARQAQAREARLATKGGGAATHQDGKYLDVLPPALNTIMGTTWWAQSAFGIQEEGRPIAPT
jgi:hypothetical protein